MIRLGCVCYLTSTLSPQGDVVVILSCMQLYRTIDNLATITLGWQSHEGQNISFHGPLNCLFKGLYRLTTNTQWKLCITDPLSWESSGFPAQRASRAKGISMSWHHGWPWMFRSHTYQLVALDGLWSAVIWEAGFMRWSHLGVDIRCWL